MVPDAFYDLMELICDNCSMMRISNPGEDPQDYREICEGCAIEQGLQDALSAAFCEGVSFGLAELQAKLAEMEVPDGAD